MKCPNCNINLYDKCCPRCGYLESGNMVNLKDKPDKYIDEKNINNDFDKLYRNENNIIPTLLGGFYLAFHKCALSASLITMLEFCSFILVNIYIGRIPYFGAYAPVINFLVFLAFRLFFGAISNTIILFWDKVRIKHYKKIHPNNYQKYLYKYKNTSLFGIIIYIPIYVLSFIFVLIFN